MKNYWINEGINGILLLKKYDRIMNDIKDASNCATCLECSFNIYQKDMSLLLIVNIVLEIKRHS